MKKILVLLVLLMGASGARALGSDHDFREVMRSIISTSKDTDVQDTLKSFVRRLTNIQNKIQKVKEMAADPSALSQGALQKAVVLQRRIWEDLDEFHKDLQEEARKADADNIRSDGKGLLDSPLRSQGSGYHELFNRYADLEAYYQE